MSVGRAKSILFRRLWIQSYLKFRIDLKESIGVKIIKTAAKTKGKKSSTPPIRHPTYVRTGSGWVGKEKIGGVNLDLFFASEFSQNYNHARAV